MARVTGAIAELIAVHCGKCDIDFGMPRYFYETRKQDGVTWYCPVGHPRVFTGTSEIEKLREQLADARAATDAVDQQRRAAEARSQLLMNEQARLLTVPFSFTGVKT